MTLLITFGVIELFLRYFMPIDYRPPPSELGYVGQETIYQASTVPELDYELKPNFDGMALGIKAKTNSYGMRDDEPLSDSRDRLVIIGDSFTFGFGVPQESTFPALLEQKLNQVDDKYDVLNLAVAGYNLQNEVKVLEYKGLVWKPKIVMIGYVLNDPEIEPIQELPSYFHKPDWWQYSHVLRLVARGVKKTQINIYGAGDYYKYLHANPTTWQSVVAGFKEIREMTAKSNIRVIVIIFPILGDEWANYPYTDLHHQVSALAEENNFEVIDLKDFVSGYPPEDLRLSIQDGHPNVLFHKITAEAIFARLSR